MRQNIVALPSVEPSERPDVDAPRYFNLPRPPTPFIGRDGEVATACELLRRPEVHVLTLLGPPGIGKTRLGIEVAADLVPYFADGVYFVSLAPISDPALVTSAVALPLGVKEAQGQSLAQSLQHFLGDKQILLVLDNFEQVVEAAPMLAELLEVCSHVKVLVTSREVLHLHGEYDYPVPPLSLPDLNRFPDLEALPYYEAIALFLQRAQAVSPGFELTERNAHAVAEICLRLDGLPLAIELAAARIPVLPPEELLARLASRLRLLTGGARNLPERQRTLQAAIDWSYNLLDPAEQTLFHRLGVFVGGCTLNAIEQVCGGEAGDTRIDVLEVVTSLLSKSLLQRQEQQGTSEARGEPRFTMLETLREYARDKLQASEEAEELRRRHVHYFVKLVERVEPELRGPEQVVWLDRLEEEQDNIRAVFEWCRREESGAEGAQIGLRLVGALHWYWFTRGPFSEGRERAAEMLSRPDAKEHTSWRVQALRTAAILAWIQGDFESVRSIGEEGLALARELADRKMEAVFLSDLGHVALEAEEGDLALARSLYEQSLAIQREMGNRHSVAVALTNLGLVDRAEGDLASARPRLEEALAITGELGDKAGIALTLQRLGELAYREGNYPPSRSLLEQALVIRREMGDKVKLPEILDDIGYAALREDDYDAAAAHFRESLTFGGELGTRRYIGLTIAALATLAVSRREGVTKGVGEPRLRQAAKLFGASEGLLEVAGVKIDPWTKAELDRDIAAARALLDVEAWQEAWEEGQAMSMEEAIAEALQSLEPNFLIDTGDHDKTEPRGRTAPDCLTDRELEVARLIAAGKSNQEIATELVLSLRTVERHISNIYQKIGAGGRVARASTAAYVISRGLV